MKNAKFLSWILTAGILIVLNLFFTYAINSFYPEPKWDAYCPQKQVTVQPKDQTECVARGGAWTDNQNYPAKPVPVGYTEPRGYCDLNFTCQKDFNTAHDLYARNVFVIRVILGVVSILIGFATATYDAVSLGLSLGGVLSLLIGTIGYWSNMNDYLRAVVLGVALIILIWIGVKKLQPTITHA